MLSLVDLHCQFGTHVVFKGLNLVVHAGQRVGLVGKNGTGKTTLFSIMTGALSPDEGEVAMAKGVRVAYMKQ